MWYFKRMHITRAQLIRFRPLSQCCTFVFCRYHIVVFYAYAHTIEEAMFFWRHRHNVLQLFDRYHIVVFYAYAHNTDKRSPLIRYHHTVSHTLHPIATM